MGWWWWLLPTSGGSSYGSGVSHIHNPGAVFTGEGGKGDFFGATSVSIIYEQLYSEHQGAVCPEIAGRSSEPGSEPLKYLPEGFTCVGSPISHNRGFTTEGLSKSDFHGAVCPEIAGRSSKPGCEPLKYLPKGEANVA